MQSFACYFFHPIPYTRYSVRLTADTPNSICRSSRLPIALTVYICFVGYLPVFVHPPTVFHNHFLTSGCQLFPQPFHCQYSLILSSLHPYYHWHLLPLHGLWRSTSEERLSGIREQSAWLERMIDREVGENQALVWQIVGRTNFYG